MIYIDPPYNTGNDFVYNDNFTMESDLFSEVSGEKDEVGNRMVVNSDSNGRFHTDWLNMMYPRLKVARDLLSEDGMIFISIDDNEICNLKKLCDEVFGPANFKSQSIIMNNRGGRDYGGIALQHDYIVIYTKSNEGELNLVDEKDKEFQYSDQDGGFNLMELRNRNVKFNKGNRPNLCYPFYVNPNKQDSNGLMEISLEPKEGYVEVYPAISNGIQTVWRWGKEEKARKNLNKEIFGKANRNGGYMIVQKYRKTTKMQRSIWDEKEFVNERGTEAVKELFGGKAYFDYPKSVFTICRTIELGSDENSIVLDFFSGSSTTAEAVMRRNAEDGGCRKYIMVQLDEKLSPDSVAKKDGYNNICEIAEERIRRAAAKIKSEMEAEGKDTSKMDFGFRVLKLDSSNMKDVYHTPQETDIDNIFTDSVKEDRTAEDLLFQVMPKCDLKLSEKITKEIINGKEVYFVKDNYLAACFDNDLTDEVITEIAKRQPFHFVMKEGGAAQDSVLDNFEQLFRTYSPGTKCMVI